MDNLAAVLEQRDKEIAILKARTAGLVADLAAGAAAAEDLAAVVKNGEGVSAAGVVEAAIDLAVALRAGITADRAATANHTVGYDVAMAEYRHSEAELGLEGGFVQSSVIERSHEDVGGGEYGSGGEEESRVIIIKEREGAILTCASI